MPSVKLGLLFWVGMGFLVCFLLFVTARAWIKWFMDREEKLDAPFPWWPSICTVFIVAVVVMLNAGYGQVADTETKQLNSNAAPKDNFVEDELKQRNAVVPGDVQEYRKKDEEAKVKAGSVYQRPVDSQIVDSISDFGEKLGNPDPKKKVNKK